MANPRRGFVLVLVLLSVVACNRHSGTVKPSALGNPVPVRATPVEQLSVPERFEVVGTVAPAQAAILESRITGHIQDVRVREGDKVNADEVLVRIDDREPNLQIEQAQAGLAQATQGLNELMKVAEASRQSYEAAVANEKLAKVTYDRVRDLAERGAVSRQALDEAQAKWKAATAEAARAHEIVQSYEAKKAEVRARVEASSAALQQSEVYAGHTEMKAPFPGLVTRKYVDKGDLASPGVPLIAVEDTSSYRLEAPVDEARVDSIALGMESPVVIDALGSDALPGQVIEMVPAADRATRTFIVKIQLPQKAGLHSGMFGRAQFTTGQRSVLAVPRDAVFERGQLTGVYVVTPDSRAHMRLITVGESTGDHVEVLSGLDEGEVVISPVSSEVEDGMPVRTN